MFGLQGHSDKCLASLLEMLCGQIYLLIGQSFITSLAYCNESIYSSQSLALFQQTAWFCDVQESCQLLVISPCNIGFVKSRFSINHVGFVGNIEFGLEKVVRSYSFLLAKFLSDFIQLI